MDPPGITESSSAGNIQMSPMSYCSRISPSEMRRFVNTVSSGCQ